VKTLQSIQNRWQRLKQEFDIVKDLRATPGFKWNDQEQSIRASREVWDAYIKTHPMANKFRKKPFLLYDTIAYLVDSTQATATNPFLAGQKSAFTGEHTPSLGSYNYNKDDELAAPSLIPPDRKRSKSAGTAASERQKIRRMSAGQGIMSEIAAPSMRNTTDAQTQTTR